MTSDGGTKTARSCSYPECGAEVVQSADHIGAPKKYCANPEHTAVRAWKQMQKLRKAAEQKAAKQPAPTTRPVTDGTARLDDLARRMLELRGELAANLAEFGEVLGAMSAPQAAADEIEDIRRDYERRLLDAESARTTAERDAATARIERDQAVEAAQLASEATEEAIRGRDDANALSQRTKAEAAEQVAAAEADRDRIRSEADAEIASLQTELETARTDHALLDQQYRAALNSVQRQTAESNRLRTALDEEQRAHRAQLDDLHASHREELNAAHTRADETMREMRHDHAEQLAAVRADYQRALADLAPAHQAMPVRPGEFTVVNGARR